MQRQSRKLNLDFIFTSATTLPCHCWHVTLSDCFLKQLFSKRDTSIARIGWLLLGIFVAYCQFWVLPVILHLLKHFQAAWDQPLITTLLL